MPDDALHGSEPASVDPDPSEHLQPPRPPDPAPPGPQTPYAQDQPYPPAPSLPPAQPYQPGQGYPPAQPFPPAQPLPPAQAFPAPQAFPPAQPFPPAQAFPPVQAQPYEPGQPYQQGEPYQQGQPFPPAQAPAHPFPPAPPGTTPEAAFGPPFASPDQLVAAPAPLAAEAWVEPGDVRAASTIAGVLIVVGILAGVLWSAISPHAQGIVVSKTEIIPLEQENWIAADGRFAIITAIIGLVAGAVAWFWRSRRGPVLAAGLAVGAGVGALMTALVGYWLSSGHGTGAVNTEIRLKVLVHAHGLIALEAVLALAAYLVGVLLSGPDDLGRSSVGSDGSDGQPAPAVSTGPPMADQSVDV